jgi:hypothetical protein
MEAKFVDEAFSYWATFAIPIGLIAVTAFGRKLVSKAPFHWPHFYLGIELTLAALATGLVNILDLEKTVSRDQVKTDHTDIYVFMCIVLYMLVLCYHQQYEDDTHPDTEIFWLGKVSNAIGLVLVGGFVGFKTAGIL